jgi:hypothetical protein
MPDADLLEPFGAPDIAVHADRAEIEGGDAERLRADLAVPGIEAPEEEIGIAIGQSARLDGVHVVDQEEEHVAIARIERGRVLGHVDMGIVGHARPVEQARDLPSGIAGAVAGDLHHRGDQFVIPDPAIVGSGDGAQFGASILGLERLHEFRAVREEAVLHVDAGERGGKLAEVARRRADQTGELAERPMGRLDRLVATGYDEREAFGIVARGFDPDRPRFDGPGCRTIGAGLHRLVELGQRQIALVVGTREPLRTDAGDTLTPRDVDLVAAGRGGLAGGLGKDSSHGKSPERAPGASLPTSSRHGIPASL